MLVQSCTRTSRLICAYLASAGRAAVGAMASAELPGAVSSVVPGAGEVTDQPRPCSRAPSDAAEPVGSCTSAVLSCSLHARCMLAPCAVSAVCSAAEPILACFAKKHAQLHASHTERRTALVLQSLDSIQVKRSASRLAQSHKL